MANEERRRRVIVWLFYGAAASLIPPLWDALKLVLQHKPHGFWEAISTGQLITVAFLIAAAAAGDLLGRKKTLLHDTELAIIGSTFLLLMCGGWLYAIIAALPDASDRIWPGASCLFTIVIGIVIGISSVCMGND
ncbi:hypothetical protein [Mycolicibacterium nivoides]|uniref:hypothetical protein n=1 Tax=Mycolicibacterium nivoides TaxID=2487344 RepID=UPI003C2B0B4B